MADGPSGRLRKAAQIFDAMRAEAPDRRVSIGPFTDRCREAGILDEDFEAFLREQSRGLLQAVSKLRLKGDEAQQAPLNLTETLPDGSVEQYNKAIEDMTPKDCASFMHGQAKIIRREIDTGERTVTSEVTTSRSPVSA